MTRSIQTQMVNILDSFGISPDIVKKHNNGSFTLKFKIEDAVETARLFDTARQMAWKVLEILPESEIVDYFDATFEGVEYHNIILVPAVPQVEVAAPVVEAAEQAKAVVEAAFEAGKKVWAAVRYNGKAVRITGEVLASGDVVKVRSTRTGQEYDVPATLVFESRPDVSVLELVA